MNSLGKRIRLLRKEKKLTQEEMGKFLNMGKSTVSQYESDISRPDYETLQKITDLFNVSVDYILGRTDIRNYDMSNEKQIVSEKEASCSADEEKQVSSTFFRIFKEAEKKGISIDDMKIAIEFIEMMKKKNEWEHNDWHTAQIHFS